MNVCAKEVGHCDGIGIVTKTAIMSVSNQDFWVTFQRNLDSGNQICQFKPDLHIIRAAGQMWPSKAFYLARKVQHLDCFFFIRNILFMCETCNF